MLIAFHKPFGVLSQFTEEIGSQYRTLAAFNFPKNVYPIGRLDADSEGLLLLSDQGEFNHQLLNPKFEHRRTYWAQVENIPSLTTLKQLENGVEIQGYRTLPCSATRIETPDLPERTPPIRTRASIPTSWISLELIEGKNRQVRRMTAAVGHPTLRLIRTKIGDFTLGNLPEGEWRELTGQERERIISHS
ncbi:MAG: pseudouridine synthase [Ignavibacteria bacterium]|nr:pseudouridine synthase [Ignavibacteria bacterium]